MAGEDYLAIVKGNRAEQRLWQSRPPLSCPNDGTPLVSGPPSQPGIKFCPFDGWQYPRDWVPPLSPP